MKALVAMILGCCVAAVAPLLARMEVPLATARRDPTRETRAPTSPRGLRPSPRRSSMSSSRSTTPSMGTSKTSSPAIPGFVDRLLNPHCVSTKTCTTTADCTSVGASSACERGMCYLPGDNGGASQCKSVPGTTPGSPVHDLHRHRARRWAAAGSPDVCVESSSDPTHQDDHGHLLNRTLTGTTEGLVTNAKPLDGNGGNFLAWLPASNPANSGQPAPNVTVYSDGQSSQLVTDFQALVTGVQQHGCGLEAQLEELVPLPRPARPVGKHHAHERQPPESAIHRRRRDAAQDAPRLPQAGLGGGDHPDHGRRGLVERSAVVRRLRMGGTHSARSRRSWTRRGPARDVRVRRARRRQQHIGHRSERSRLRLVHVPELDQAGVRHTHRAGSELHLVSRGLVELRFPGWYVPASPSVPINAADGLNVRYSRQIMRQKYGFDNQHNYHRYVDALTSQTVPDRNNEPHSGGGVYMPNRNCRNPLFAESLPDGSDTSASTLCDPRAGYVRTPSLVFYAIIGGVPSQLLTDSNGNPKLDLAKTDWQAILGQDPDDYIFDGIDPHTIQSTAPRAGCFPRTHHPLARTTSALIRSRVASGTRSRHPPRSISNLRARSTCPRRRTAPQPKIRVRVTAPARRRLRRTVRRCAIRPRARTKSRARPTRRAAFSSSPRRSAASTWSHRFARRSRRATRTLRATAITPL